MSSKGAVLIDSGFATQLRNYISGNLDDHPLWVARFLVHDKNACLSVHKDFIRSGSTIIRSNTYQLSLQGFIKHMEMSEKEVTDLVYVAVNLCRQAVEEVKHPDGVKVKIAGSVGPYGASLHDGSEYTGSYCDSVTSEEFKEWHRWRVSNLLKAGVDLLAIETVPCSKEALAILDLLKEFPQAKAWLSFSIKNEKEISNGENFAESAKKCWDKSNGQLVAIGANCCKPEFILSLLTSLKEKDSSIPFIAYPNSGETFDEVNKRWIEGSNKGKVADYVPHWLEKGISYVGACCRNTASDLLDIGKVLKNRQKVK
ncbi:homocysteine S-methyltransferase 3-like [Cimex lectularius]|uniref:Hcy-binding domain-containing protein n=1 Tax=Cimex lectularius TaxID=79782 RepID=A0A8I6RPU9_CIMLE|nr:homocysteine S-methyltransferase 3-like [Cimex lectularius]XP_014247721.1 homocysteine S-methyltransferase 3-like [Cimex lectularius]XP_014247722.1 homocysteine S-methyltransferase 3-like [Cimex lectularius]